MPFVYIVVENSDDEPPGGGVFPMTFTTFEEARKAIITKYKEQLNYEREASYGEPLASEINVPESETEFTHLYIEKGMNFYIHKLFVKQSGGKTRRKTRRN